MLSVPKKEAQEHPMLTIAILCLALIPVALDVAIRGLHTTHELTMKRPDQA